MPLLGVLEELVPPALLDDPPLAQVRVRVRLRHRDRDRDRVSPCAG